MLVQTLFAFSLLLATISTMKTFLENSVFKEQDDYEAIQESMREQDFLTVIVYYKSTFCIKCAQGDPVLRKFGKKYEGVVNFYKVDCHKLQETGQSSKIPVCEIDQMLPMTTFYSPPKIKYDFATKKLNDPEESIYGGDFKVSQLSEFTERLLPVFRTLVNTTDDLEHFLSFADLPNKVILFTESVTTSTMLKAMTSYYRDRLDFAEIRRSRKKQHLCDRFSIKKYPTLLLLQNIDGQYQQIEYKGAKTLEDIVAWLKPYAKQNRIIRPIDQYDGYPKVFQLETAEAINNSLYQNSLPVILHLRNANVHHHAFKEVVAHFQNELVYYEVDLAWANELFPYSSASLLFFLPGITPKNATAPKVFTQEDTLENVREYLNRTLKIQATQLKHHTARNYFANALGQESPTLVFLVSSTDQSDAFLHFNLATHSLDYRRVMRFAYYFDPPKTIQDGFSVQALPTVICIFPKNKLGEQQLGSLRIEINAFNLKQFADEIYERYQNKIIPETIFSEINSHEIFQQKCQLDMEYCYIAILDASKRLYEIANPFTQLYKQLEMLDDYYEILAKDEEQISLSWIDGPCYNEIMVSMNLKLQSLPRLIAYNPSTDKYKMMKKEFTLENIKHFISQSKKSKKFYKKLKEFREQGLDFDSKDCEKLHAEREMGGHQKEEL